MFRFTIRDVLWLTVVVAMGIMLAIQHQQASTARKRIIAELGQPTNFDFVQIPLRESALYISYLHRTPVLLADGVDGETPVTATFRGPPLKTALDGILPPLDLDYEVKEGWILIKPL
jgi:hypothetical protein